MSATAIVGHSRSRSNRSYTRAQMIARWWSDEVIEALLGMPDEYTAAKYNTKLYVPRWNCHRVHEAEKLASFLQSALAWRTKSENNTIERNRNAGMFMRGVDIRMTGLPVIADIFTHLENADKNNEPITDTKVLCHIRHQYTNYDEVVARAKSAGILNVFYEEVFRATMKVVISAYPELSQVGQEALDRKFTKTKKSKRCHQ